jgi:hypothetical protein
MKRARIACAFLCVAVIVASACSDDGDSKKAKRKTEKSTTTTTTTVAGTGDGTTTTGGSGPGSNRLPAVAVGTAAPLAENLFVTVTKVEPVTLEAHGTGETSGPGVLVTIDIRNATSAPLDLATMAVNAHYGDTPATPNGAPPAKPFSGSLAPGATATAKYAFRVPSNQAGAVVVDIQSSSGPNVVIVDAGK